MSKWEEDTVSGMLFEVGASPLEFTQGSWEKFNGTVLNLIMTSHVKDKLNLYPS